MGAIGVSMGKASESLILSRKEESTMRTRHRVNWICGAALLALFGFSCPLLSQESGKRIGCFKCKRTGKLECTVPKAETHVLDCTHYYKADDECGGVGFTVCNRCKSEEAQYEFDNATLEIKQWIALCREFEDACGEKGVLVQTENVRVFYAIPKMSVKKRRVDLHRGAHHFAKRLEEVFQDYTKIFDIEEEIVNPRHTVFLLEDVSVLSSFLKHYYGSGGGNAGGHKSTGNQRSWFAGARKAGQSGDEFEQTVIHNFAHLLMEKCMVARKSPTWLVCGFAHFMEHKYYRANRNFCFVEVAPDDRFQGGNSWKSKVKKEAGSRNPLAFVDFYGKDINAYTYREMAFSFAYVDFLMNYNIEQFRDLVGRIKGGTDSLEAVQSIYNWLPAELDNEWRRWVKARY